MTMTPDAEQFLRDHRFGVVTTLKKGGAPQATAVYYIYENGKLYISVTKERKKTINVLRDPRVVMVALAEEPPLNYVQVMGTATITEDDLVETTRRIWRTFRPQLPDDFADLLAQQKRVLMVVTPETVTSRINPPR